MGLERSYMVLDGLERTLDGCVGWVIGFVTLENCLQMVCSAISELGRFG
jgi:hypothetical protein